MAIPILPFVAGALVGGLSVYLYRNEKLHRVVGRSASNLSGKVKRTAAQASDDVSDGPDGLDENDSSKSAEAPTRKKKTAKRRAKKPAFPRKEGPGRKTATKKAPD